MSSAEETRTKLGNVLLDAMPPEVYRSLEQHLQEVNLEQGKLIIAPDEPIRDIHFPIDCMISLVSLLSDGTTIEAGVIGREGMAGVPVLLGASTTPMQSVVQIPGRAFRIRAGFVVEEFKRGGAFQALLFRYMQAIFLEISQTAACNNQHRIDGRLARWLLLSSDCVGSNELRLTQEFISTMLGVRRAGVTEAALALQERGIISSKRGHITILDRIELEEYACECYRIVKEEMDRLLGTPL